MCKNLKVYKTYRHKAKIMESEPFGGSQDDRKRIGHHLIDVSIEDIPKEVTNLFFVLSAWNAPTISRYPNPSLSFYEKSTPEANLCSTTFTHASNYSAVVTCEKWRGSYTKMNKRQMEMPKIMI